MEMKLLRVRFQETRTNGQLYINGDFFCFTLEDPVREVDGEPVEKWKIKGETAIPKGFYRAGLEFSPKFGPDTLTIYNVPGFVGIRMHGGNNERNTEGCPLLGYKLDDNGLIVPGSSRPAVTDLKQKVREAIKNKEKITIEITDLE